MSRDGSHRWHHKIRVRSRAERLSDLIGLSGKWRKIARRTRRICSCDMCSSREGMKPSDLRRCGDEEEQR